MRVLVTGGAGYIGSHAVQGAGRRRARRGGAGRPVGRPRRGRPRRAAWCGPECTTQPPCDRALREQRIDAVMHFAAWLDVGESVRQPGQVLREQRHRHAAACSRRWPPRACAGSSSRRPAPSTASRRACRSPRRIAPRRSTPTARPSWSSSGRCRHFERGARAAVRSRCATSTPPAPTLTASSARTTTPRFT